MENGMTTDEFDASYNFVEDLKNLRIMNNTISIELLRYDSTKFEPPFRLGKKQQRAVLDANGKEVVIFPLNSGIQASLYVNYLNNGAAGKNYTNGY